MISRSPQVVSLFFQGFRPFRNGVDRKKWVVETWSPNTDSCTQELRANSGVGVINKRAGARVCRGDARKEFQLALHQEEKGEKRAWTSVLAAVMHSTSDSSE